MEVAPAVVFTQRAHSARERFSRPSGEMRRRGKSTALCGVSQDS